jgi:hypothetical protein
MRTHEHRTGVTAQTGAPRRIASARMPSKWAMFEAIVRATPSTGIAYTEF